MNKTRKTLTLASHSVHITLTPPAQSLNESKLVLAALQKFGEVATFRNLKYDTTNNSRNTNRSIVAIFENPDSASHAIESSPLTIPIPQSKPSALPSHSSSGQTLPASSLTCTIQPSKHNHTSALRRNPYHTTFNVEADSHQYRDLMKSGIPIRELADGLTGRKGFVPARTKDWIWRENVRLGAYSLLGLWREGLEKTEGKGKGGKGKGGKNT